MKYIYVGHAYGKPGVGNFFPERLTDFILMKMLTIQFQTILPLQEILLENQQSQVMKKLKNI